MRSEVQASSVPTGSGVPILQPSWTGTSPILAEGAHSEHPAVWAAGRWLGIGLGAS